MPQKSKKSQKPDAIILSGGMLGKKVLYPKALIEFEGKSIIERQIEYLGEFVDKIIVACKKGECNLIKKHLGEMTDVEFIEEETPLGTAGAVKNAAKKTGAERFIICNVDSISDVDLGALINFGPDAVCVANPRLDFGVVKEDKNTHNILEFREKPIIKNIWVNCGIYFLTREMINKFPDVGSLERDVFPFNSIKAFKHFGIFKHF